MCGSICPSQSKNSEKAQLLHLFIDMEKFFKRPVSVCIYTFFYPKSRPHAHTPRNRKMNKMKEEK